MIKRLLQTLIAPLALFSTAPLAAADDLVIGNPAPEFELPDQTGQLHSLEDYRDQWVVLYFYPKDETPGCTTQACELRDNIFEFRANNAQILGVSFDDVETHAKFAENHSLPFPLLADTEGKAADAYGVKTRYLGFVVAKRQTFLIDPQGNIAKHYEKVDPDTPSEDVLADLRALGASNEQASATP
ncbi:MAG: peroxiredoxin [Pseudomonadota bacterium]